VQHGARLIVNTTLHMPTGTATFLFTDIERSTRMVQELGQRWLGVLEAHNRMLREADRGWAIGQTVLTTHDGVQTMPRWSLRQLEG
jgi:hypothetical protein